jgi:NTP pyrophosphatase (non-canonical NTP hydrolase)
MASRLYLKPNPTLDDVQAYVRLMEQERGFTKDDIAGKCMLLSEEVGELFKCVRKSHTTLGIDSSKQYDFDAAGEIADILIVLTTIANRLGVDLEQAFRAKEDKNKQRQWH